MSPFLYRACKSRLDPANTTRTRTTMASNSLLLFFILNFFIECRLFFCPSIPGTRPPGKIVPLIFLIGRAQLIRLHPQQEQVPEELRQVFFYKDFFAVTGRLLHGIL